MICIHKGSQPPELVAWSVINRNTTNYCFAGGEFPKGPVKAALLREQGFLCAYTMQRIDDETSHIEHLKPQCCCQSGEDVDYGNLLACHPGPNTRSEYGAQRKADWWPGDIAPLEMHFVSPLHPHCEQHFRYDLNGNMLPHREDDNIAAQTIKILGLQNPVLIGLRRSRVRTALKNHRHEPLSLGEAQRKLAELDSRDADGRLPPFLAAVRQTLQGHIERMERKRTAKQLAARARRRDD